MSQYFIVYSKIDGEILWNGYGVINQQHIPEDAAIFEVTQEILLSKPVDLEKIKQFLCSKVDAEAELTRRLFITPGSGQAMEYQEAYNQARQYSGNPSGVYRMLQADVDVGTIDERTGNPVTSLAEAADLIMYMYESFDIVGSAIKYARLGAKKNINQATNIKDIVESSYVDWATILTLPEE